MTKWADYLISAVRYNSTRNLITEVKQIKDLDGVESQEDVVDRATVADNVKKGRKYMTVFSSGSNWQKGSEVRTFIIDGNYYIRADKNKVNRDNLGELPEF